MFCGPRFKRRGFCLCNNYYLHLPNTKQKKIMLHELLRHTAFMYQKQMPSGTMYLPSNFEILVASANQCANGGLLLISTN